MPEPKAKLAIVGMAFRLPGGIHDEDGFWELLLRGENVVGEIGPERWATGTFSHPSRAEPGRSVTFAAGTLEKIEEFDAAFFGIAPREARLMDPQQRLVLELAWEALENGGQVPSALAGSDCAVCMGVSAADFMLRAADDLSGVEGHTMTGSVLSIIANRVSYALDLRGASLAVDTACSSSLVALHQACQAIWRGEAPSALVGGVNLLLHPLPFIGFSKASMLSPGGRCRTFDARGDGYARSEGGVVLFIKPLEQALRDGDPIQAVILSTGVNSDGRNEGMTIPRAESQAELLQRTVRSAGVDPSRIVYVEAHGTGTAVGDPVEAAALGAAFGAGRSAENPLFIGSVKANIGHLEPASGLAGLVKSVMALKRRTLPPSLTPEVPNPQLHLEAHGLRVVSEPIPLPDTDEPALVGVNSFGFGGTNAHVMLEEHRGGEPPRIQIVVAPPLILSARTDQALRALAGRYAERLDGADSEEVYRVAFNAAFRRQPLDEGAVVLGRGPDEIVAHLRALASGEERPGVVRAACLGERTPIAFVFSGNGAQWAGMGKRLLAADPIFLESVREVDRLVAGFGDFSILEELRRDPGDDRHHLTEVAQPALFAMQVGITNVLRAQGLDPQAVTGHSVGEIAAAWAAGCLTLEQAAEVIVERSAAQGQTAGAGRMAAVGRSADEVLETLARIGLEGLVEVAVINSPRDVTVSGTVAALQALERVVAEDGAYYRLLDLDYAFHSRHMDGQRDRILGRLGHIRPSDARVPFVSTVTGGEVPGSQLDGAYWWNNIREPVLFRSAADHLVEGGTRIFLEIGPHAILQRYLAACLRDQHSGGWALPTLLRDDDGADRLREALWRVHLLGGAVRLDRHFPIRVPSIPLPNYPWQRERHWPDPSTEAQGLTERHRVHPLLGWHLGDDGAAWENHIDVRLEPWLADHRVGETTLFPATGFVEMALAASARWRPEALRHEIEELEIRAPMPLQEDRARTVRFELDTDDGSFRIRSRERLSEEPWVINAVGKILSEPSGDGKRRAGDTLVEALTGLPPGERLSDAHRHYGLARYLGFDFGPAFQGFREAWRDGEGSVLARLERPEALGESSARFLLHPALLDASLQAVLHLVTEDAEAGANEALIPVRVGRVAVRRWGVDPHWCRVTLAGRSRRSLLMNVDLFDEQGALMARVEGCRLRATPALQRRNVEPDVWEWTTELKPRSVTAPSPAPNPLEMSQAILRAFPSGAAQERRRLRHAEVLPLMEALVGIFAYEAMRDVGSGDGVLPPFPPDLSDHPFSSWLLRVLREDGLLDGRGGVLRLVEPPATLPTASRLWSAILGDHPEYLPDLGLLGRVGGQLPRILSGETSPDELSAILEDEGLWSRYTAGSPVVSDLRETVARALAERATEWPSNRRLRVLEVGGESILPTILGALPSGRFDFTHIFEGGTPPDTLWGRAQGVPGLRLTPAEPGSLIPGEALNGAGYDLVILPHRLSLELDIRSALQAIRGALAEEGLLILLERTPDRWSTFTQGLRRQWWRSGTAPSPGTLAPERWARLLTEAGFENVEVALEPEAESPPAGCFAVLGRQPHMVDIEGSERQPGRWMVLLDGSEHDRQGNGSAPPRSIGAGLARALREAGQTVVEVEAGRGFERRGTDRYTFDPLDPSSAEALIAAVHEDFEGYPDIVHALGLGETGAAESFHGDPLAAPALRVLSTLHLVTSLEERRARSGEAPPRLWLLTRGAATFADAAHVLPSAPGDAPLWGFGRVLMNEHPELRCTLLDLQDDSPDQMVIPRVLEELLEPDGEEEIVLAPKGQRRVSRLRSTSLHPEEEVSPSSAGLELVYPGQLRNLKWKVRPPRDPGAHEVEIETRAVGLNFRDVMYALGFLSDEAMEGGFAGASLGLEVSGVVRRVGRSVHDLVPGDEVVAFTSGGFAGRVVTPASAVAKKPERWSFEAAATVPTAFFTAWYALHHMARLQQGERVLIHGAAGGVGLAAIQISQHLGAEIFATAGTDEKREILRLVGVPHVMDSRSLAFAGEILAITEGEGVDVVLNSLAGEAARRNFRVLRPFGRFLELGKRDFYENARMGLRPFKDNITYYGIDADQLMLGRPALARTVLREVMELLDDGVLRPLPHRVFPASDVVGAFRYMQQSRQIGKVVVKFDNAPVPAASGPGRRERPRFRGDGTYLVAGGTGGFGLRTARWLAEHGARHLLLLSRRGMASPAANEAMTVLEAVGARAHVRACDIEDRDAVARVVRECGNDLPPLLGVIHSAMVLDDGVIRNLDADRTLRAMAPKVRGAWNLHLQTRDLPLEHFILFSSATTSIGNPGQANYVAGNLYLEALAALRRATGLPATCVGWGAIRDAGYLSRHEGLLEVLGARTGGRGLEAEQALEILGVILDTEAGGLTVTDFDWAVLDRILPTARSRRFAGMVRRAGGGGAGGAMGPSPRALLAEGTPEQVRDLLTDLVTREISEVLRLPPERIARDRTLQELGMDSLTGMELLVALETRLELRLPAMAPSQRSVAQIVDLLQSSLGQDGDACVPPIPGFDPALVRDELERIALAHGVEYDEQGASVLVEEALRKGGVSAQVP